MLPTTNLLNATADRTKTWQLDEIFDSALRAKQRAARLFVTNSGVAVKPFRDKEFIVLFWDRERRFDNECR
jgi:hypothetical protein